MGHDSYAREKPKSKNSEDQCEWYLLTCRDGGSGVGQTTMSRFFTYDKISETEKKKSDESSRITKKPRNLCNVLLKNSPKLRRNSAACSFLHGRNINSFVIVITRAENNPSSIMVRPMFTVKNDSARKQNNH